MSDYFVDATISALVSQNIITAAVTSHLKFEDKKEKYTEYRIDVSRGDEKWSVLRRYNEFDRLNDKIRKIYPGIKLRLPKKKLFGDNFDPDFVLKRQNALNEFMQEAINYPNILKMPIMLDFLQLKDYNVSVMEETEDLENFNSISNYSGNHYSQNITDFTSSERSNSDEIYLGTSNNPTANPKDFEYLSVIGKGSFGKVYMARHKIENKVYAIKILQKAAIKKRNEVKHIMAERNVLVRNIEHPFLVALHYSFQTQDKLYFVLDYVNGGELFFHLQRQRVFSENRSRYYSAEISHAIGYLHSKNIIYRDLKPENILIDKEGHIKLTDFGLCKEGIEANTTTSTFCGTPEYLAPEILLKRPYTRAVDWWCLGAVLYEMLFGLPPFYSRDTSEMYSNILNKPLRISPNTNISMAAKHIIEVLLQKEEHLRLGYSDEDFKEIKMHPFFDSINWDLLVEKRIEPPWKPNVTDVTDLKNIDPEFTQEPVSSSIVDSNNSTTLNDMTFSGFTYMPESNIVSYLG